MKELGKVQWLKAPSRFLTKAFLLLPFKAIELKAFELHATLCTIKRARSARSEVRSPFSLALAWKSNELQGCKMFDRVPLSRSAQKAPTYERAQPEHLAQNNIFTEEHPKDKNPKLKFHNHDQVPVRSHFEIGFQWETFR